MGDGPPGFRPAFTCRVLLRCRTGAFTLRLRDFHPLWSHVPEDSAGLAHLCVRSYNPTRTSPGGLGWSAFARRYSRSRFCFLFLQVLRCFSSLGWPRRAYGFSAGWFGHPGINARLTAPPGISQSSHALLRLLAPRHPPHALSSLAALILPSLALPPHRGRTAERMLQATRTTGCYTDRPGNDPALFSGSCRDSRNSGPRLSSSCPPLLVLQLLPLPRCQRTPRRLVRRLPNQLALRGNRRTPSSLDQVVRRFSPSREQGAGPARQPQLLAALLLTSLILGRRGRTVNPLLPIFSLSQPCRSGWRWGDSNPRHRGCKPRALPLSYIPLLLPAVGVPGFEPGASALSELRSSQLSYTPALRPLAINRPGKTKKPEPQGPGSIQHRVVLAGRASPQDVDGRESDHEHLSLQ